jgi:hypothetical protein
MKDALQGTLIHDSHERPQKKEHRTKKREVTLPFKITSHPLK